MVKKLAAGKKARGRAVTAATIVTVLPDGLTPGDALRQGLPTDGFVFDTALAAYLLDATVGSYDLPRLAQTYLGEELPDVQSVWALQPVLHEKMDAQAMLPLYTDVELPLCPVLARMEQAGFLVDRKALYDFGESLTSSIEQLQQSIWALAGEPFNIQRLFVGSVLTSELPQGIERPRPAGAINAPCSKLRLAVIRLQWRIRLPHAKKLSRTMRP